MVYSILEANMERLEKKLTRIQNKCKRFGCSFTYEKVGEEFKTLKDERGVEYKAKFILIEAEGKAVLNDWVFVASVHAAAEAMQAGATFTATAAQYGLNAALMACPLTWIILLIIAVIAAIFAVCNAIAKMTGVANSGFGVITGGINVVIQFFKNLGLSVANIALGIGNAIAALASNMMTAFHNAMLMHSLQG